MASIREKLLAIRQAEEANIISINRFIERDDPAALNAIVRREAKIEKLLKEAVAERIKEQGSL